MQKGEISLTLSVIGIVFSVIGIAIGSIAVQYNRTHVTEADFFPYKSTLEIRENGQVVQSHPDLRWSNNFDANGGIIQTQGRDEARIVYDATKAPGVPQNIQGQLVHTTVSLPTGWQLDGELFCEDKKGTTCQTIEKNGNTLAGLRIARDAEVVYGWNVKTTQGGDRCVVNNSNCEVSNLRIEKSETRRNSVEVAWNRIGSCSGLATGDKIWIDIIDDGEIVCVTSSDWNDNKSTCKLGSPKYGAPDGRRLPPTGLSTWKDKTEYTIRAYTYDSSAKCVSGGVSGSFIYEKPASNVPTTEPITPIATVPDQICRAEGQDCEDTYEESCTVNGQVGKKVCHKIGVCSGPGDGTKCSWDESKGSACGPCDVGNSNPGQPDPTSPQEPTQNPTQAPTTPPTNPTSPQEPTQNPTPEPRPKPQPQEVCADLDGGGNGGYNVVIVPDGFTDFATFERYAKKVIPSVKSKNLGSLVDAMNFKLYTRLSEGAGCYNDRGNIICSNPSNGKSACGAQAALIITTKPLNGGLGFGSIEEKYAPISMTHLDKYPGLAAHEIAHIVAEAFDEYVRFDRPSKEEYRKQVEGYANCTENANCGKWKDRDSSLSCVPGCYYGTFYRPALRSVMQTPFGEYHEFNIPTLWAFERHLNTKRSFSEEITGDVYHNSIHVQMVQTERDDLKVDTIQMSNSYPVLKDERSLEEFYEVSLIDSTGDAIYSQIEAKNVTFTHSEDTTELIRFYDLYLPYYQNASRLEIRNERGEILSTTNLEELNLEPTDVEQDLCGNNICDAGIGETANSCSLDCGVHLEKSEIERSDLNADGIVTTLDLAILMDAYWTEKGDITGDRETNALDYSILVSYLGEYVR